MGKVIVNSFTMSLDGYPAGPDQSLENPIGVGGQSLHEWAWRTKAFRDEHGLEGGETGVDHDFVVDGRANVRAYIMGRNMFAPFRGEWSNDVAWRGWWGEETPYDGPVFVLSHYPREPLTMGDGTTFTFVTDGLDAALKQARSAAGDGDIQISGGVSTIQQALHARAIDLMHLCVVPKLLGSGERLFDGFGPENFGYRCTKFISGNEVLHVVFERS